MSVVSQWGMRGRDRERRNPYWTVEQRSATFMGDVSAGSLEEHGRNPISLNGRGVHVL